MIFISLALFLGVIVWLMWKVMKGHEQLAILNQCIADMLNHPADAQEIAKNAWNHMVEHGYVKEKK